MEVALANRAGELEYTVEAIAWYGGLAVTPTWYAYNYGPLDHYSITHIASGALVWAGMSDHEAIRLMGALCERIDVDWTDSFEALNELRKRDPMLTVRVRRVIGEICKE